MSFFALENVKKSYGDPNRNKPVLEGIDLQIVEHEFLAIVGFSGTGKTTLVSLLAGLTRPDSGRVLLRGKEVTEPGPDRGVVFQNYSLLPWLTVADNVALAVDAAFPRWTRADRAARVREMLELVKLGPASHKKPAELSGGMRQRTALARTLAMGPEVLLLDEPLGALDALTRSKLQQEIERIWKEDRRTSVLVTNDVDEALLLADRIVILEPGPPARFGRIFEVGLARPRERTALNRSNEYRALRNEVLQYLTDLRTVLRERAGARRTPRPLPALVPAGKAAI
jgi:nitrate/nitrite transport system ATP-binding protein